jgi:hypothetical protein
MVMFLGVTVIKDSARFGSRLSQRDTSLAVLHLLTSCMVIGPYSCWDNHVMRPSRSVGGHTTRREHWFLRDTRATEYDVLWEPKRHEVRVAIDDTSSQVK